MFEKEYLTKKIIDNVEIIEYKDGHTEFKPLPEKCGRKIEQKKSLWEKIKSLFKKHEVSPYIKIRDLADPDGRRSKDPFDYDAGSDGKNAAEIGIKVKF